MCQLSAFLLFLICNLCTCCIYIILNFVDSFLVLLIRCHVIDVNEPTLLSYYKLTLLLFVQAYMYYNWTNWSVGIYARFYNTVNNCSFCLIFELCDTISNIPFPLSFLFLYFAFLPVKLLD